MHKLLTYAALTAILFFVNLIQVRRGKKQIGPIEVKWLYRLAGHIPLAAIGTTIFVLYASWAVFFGGSNWIKALPILAMLYIAASPSWWVYRGENGYLVGQRMIHRKDILEETITSRPRPNVTLTIATKTGKTAITFRLPSAVVQR